STASGGELVLQKVPPLTVEQAPVYPENLARYALGAQVEITPKTDTVSESALLAGDPTVGCAIGSGTTTILVSLARIENIDSVSYLDQGANDHVPMATSQAKLTSERSRRNTVGAQDL